ncbi:MAG: tyrosine protein kinase, partial [Muribaculaceae bacterium]|nr:tyrosine protein kinase [Muribaculaceae bacterium]
MSRPLIQIAPEFERLRPFLENIEEHFAAGRVIHSGRNEIRAISLPGAPELNVKRYHRPIWVNRVAYTFLRKPKGVRAFEYPRVLLEKGFDTPAPVAYIERREGGLIAFSYFVSVQSDLGRRFFEFGDATEEQYGSVMREFARLTARLHEAG